MSLRLGSFHLTGLFVLLLSLTHVSFTVHAENLLKQANESSLYLKQHLASLKIVNDIDTVKVEHAVNTLNKALDKYDINDKDVFWIKINTAKSLYLINLKRLLHGDQIDTSQVEQVKADLDFTINKSRNPNELLYDAGHNALHLLQASQLAYEYWSKCANLGHAGCMNTLAQLTFTGESALEVNLPASIQWHQKVIQTQIQFNCAGIYSSNTLMQMAYHLKHLETGNTWQNWQAERNNLFNQLKEAKRFKQPNYCNLNNILMMDFVLQKGIGIEDLNILDSAIELTTDAEHVNALLVMKNRSNAASALSFLSNIKDNYTICITSLSLVLYAKYSQQEKDFSILNDYMTTLDRQHCAQELALVQHMQTAGQW